MKLQTIFKQTLLIIGGVIAAIAFTAFPIIGFGFFFMTPLIILVIATHIMIMYIKGEKLDTDDIKEGLEIAFLCTFGGIAYGVSLLINNWAKTKS